MPSSRFVFDRNDEMIAAAKSGDVEAANAAFSALRTELSPEGAQSWIDDVIKRLESSGQQQASSVLSEVAGARR